MKPLPRWIVWTPEPVNGKRWHVLPTRSAQRSFADLHHGYRYELIRSKK